MALRFALALLLAAGAAAAGLGLAGVAQAGEVAGRTPKPTIERATRGAQCVEEVGFMRRNHMDLLKHQRDETVFGGIRGAKHSLKECIACHASAQTGSVAKAETNFCVSCHAYTAVKIDCFECHSTKPAALPAAALTFGARPGKHAGTAQRARRMRLETPASPPALSRKREREIRGTLVAMSRSK